MTSEARLDAADARLLAQIDHTMAEASRRAGPHLVCRPGCTECCIGPFPITELDARRLRRGLLALEAAAPEVARALRQRAQAARQAMRRGFPGDFSSGVLREDLAAEAKLGAFLDRHAELPCPALDPSTGACQLYAWRPITCRTYGPPVRIGGNDLPPCHLCFRGASAATVEACRVEPDAAGLEDELLDRLAADHAGADGETFIAFALGDDRWRA